MINNTDSSSNNVEVNFKFSFLQPRYWLTWTGLSIFFLVSLLPQSLRHLIGRFIGRLIYFRNKKRRHIVLTNIKIVFPTLNNDAQHQLARQHLQWYGCALLDYSLLFFASRRRLNKLVCIEGKEFIDRAIEKNQSVIILLAHSVMLEFAPIALSFNYDCYGSYKQSENPVINWLITKSRCRYVKFVISREQGLRKIIRELIPKQLLIFLPDEDLGKKNSVFAPFFGKEKATLTTPARIAKLGKAVSLPCFSYYDEEISKYKVVITSPIEEYPSSNSEDDACKLNHHLEQLIKRHPSQYMWLMKLYRTRPDGKNSLY